MELIKIPLGNQTITLKMSDFEDEIDIDDLTKIHYSNLYGEIVTVSALLNRVGIWQAELNNAFERAQHLHDILKAEKRKFYRDQADTLGEKLTIQQVEDKILLDGEVKKSKIALMSLRKSADIVSSMYWAVQSKDKKLSVLMKGVTPEEFENEIIEGKLNGFVINKVKNTIKTLE